MIATCVFVHVKTECIEEFKKVTKFNHENSRLEPGNLRFDILQQVEDTCKFTFYEAYINEDAVLAHKNTEHYLKWKETVEPFMAESRKSIKHTVVYPDDLALW
jgi:(4S)-4-hydroxy-5-phosphonooxypentane-2,3-dione isomerase